MNGPMGTGFDIGRSYQRGLSNMATRSQARPGLGHTPSGAAVVQPKDFWSDARDSAVGVVEDVAGAVGDVFSDPLRAAAFVGTGGLSELSGAGLAYDALTNMPSPDLSGSEALAELYRRDWQDYLRTFVPIENELIGSYRNMGDRREARGLALQDVNRGFDSAQAAMRDRLGRYGLAMTPQQQAEQQRRSGFARGLAEIEAINRTSRRMDDRDMELMTTGARAPALPGVG